MVRLLRDGARKPVLAEARAIPSMTWEDGKPFYRLSLYAEGEKCHDVLLTRADMIVVFSEWMKNEAQLAVKAEKDAAASK